MSMHDRKQFIETLRQYFGGHIAKHRANVNNLLDNNVALAEHPDIIETIEKELAVMADYEDKLNVLDKYFGNKIIELTNPNRTPIYIIIVDQKLCFKITLIQVNHILLNSIIFIDDFFKHIFISIGSNKFR